MRKFLGKKPESLDFQDIIYEKKDFVARVAFNRPEVYNTYRTETLRELLIAFEDAANDDSVAVVVLTGTGDKAFCTGGDVNEYASDFNAVPRDFVKWGNLFMSVNDKLRHMGKPTIARVNGMAVGGGNEFQLSCDLAIAAEHAKMFQVGTSVGSVAAVSCWFLPLAIGDRRAREMLLLNRRLDAKTALEWGLVNQVVPYEKLDEAVDEMAGQLVDKFSDCLRFTLLQTNYFKDQVAAAQQGNTTDWLAMHFMGLESYEGMNSFVEKRKMDHRRIRKLAAEGESSEYLWGAPVRKCSKCGTKGIPDKFKFCGVCGNELD
ncbi:MAG: enoyl-CoA hydratase/isomerase family protein [Syntrophaceae bacterium]|nr:enoyl-CoA hydratase/isomerase family protein [Syntrophaceae bacterium]